MKRKSISQLFIYFLWLNNLWLLVLPHFPCVTKKTKGMPRVFFWPLPKLPRAVKNFFTNKYTVKKNDLPFLQSTYCFSVIILKPLPLNLER